MSMVSADRERLREVCERYGVVRLEVFGSIEDLSAELTEILGHPVDLISRGALNARLRDTVLSEARPFYAAA